MIRVSQLKLKPDESEKKLKNMIIHTLKLPADAQIEWKIFKKSLDARHKPDIYYVYSVDVYNVIISGKNTALNDIIEGKITKKQKHKMQIKNASMACINEFDFPAKDVNYSLDSHKRPVIAGFGPAGIFAALKLAEAGLKPIVIERGEPVDERRKTVENFWNTGELDTESNVQFGEGGAGTFSDGKLNTLVKDPVGRNRKVLELFVEAGADEEILYEQKPHLGTDELIGIVTYIRKEIERLGGEVRFHCQMTDLLIQNGQIHGVQATDLKTGEMEEIASGQVVLAGEVKTSAYIDLQLVAREVIKKIGYTKGEYMFESNSCGVFSAIHEQSADINRGVEREDPMNQGAGDQGMMFGYATNETENYMPLSLDLAHRILLVLADIRREGKEMTYLRPDAKSQVTIEYDDNGKPVRIDTIVVSTQHDDFIQPADDSAEAQLKADEEMLAVIRKDVIEILMPRVIASIHHADVLALFNDNIIYHVNPTGKFVIGGPHGDTGLTGRKIIVDTYGGKGAHGGGAFSGKDPSKVDRSAAYAARHIAKNLVAAGVADEMLVQVSYAIGVARPINIYVDTYGRSNVKMSDGEIAKKIDELFDLRPKAIEERLKLRNPIYSETAAYGHMGREPRVVTKTFSSRYQPTKTVEVELFTWEKLDYVDKVKAAFGL